MGQVAMFCFIVSLEIIAHSLCFMPNYKLEAKDAHTKPVKL